MTLPNFVSLCRLFSGPYLAWLILNGRPAFFLFVIAGLSDALDGYLARRFGSTSSLGLYLDPLADKVLILSVGYALFVIGSLPLWFLFIVLSREIMIFSGALYVTYRRLSLPAPLMISKINTALILILLALLLLPSVSFLPFELLFASVTLTTFISGLWYTKRFWENIK